MFSPFVRTVLIVVVMVLLSLVAAFGAVQFTAAQNAPQSCTILHSRYAGFNSAQNLRFIVEKPCN